jgi:sialic acid synthase SpsE
MLKIIAEAGCNWSTLEEAKQFIDESKKLGLWATKFQVYNDDLIKDNPNREFLKSIMIGEQEAMELLDYGDLIGQTVFFSVMYPEAVEWLEELGVKYYKIRFKDRYNEDLFLKIYDTKKRFFISQNLDLTSVNERIIPLFCIPKYPSDYYDYMTPTNPYYRNYLYKGVSDHTPDMELFLKHSEGYEYWEKHVMLDGTEPLEKEWSIEFEKLRGIFDEL